MVEPTFEIPCRKHRENIPAPGVAECQLDASTSMSRDETRDRTLSLANRIITSDRQLGQLLSLFAAASEV